MVEKDLVADKPPASFGIPKSAFRHLAALAQHADKLDAIVKELQCCESPADHEASAKTIAKATGIRAADISDVFDGLSSLRGLMDRTEMSASTLVEVVDTNIEEQATSVWKSTNLDNWRNAKPQIAEVLAQIPDSSPLGIQQKARDLTYAHQNVLTESAIITDLRPIFDTTGDRIRALVLTHMLSISYSDGGTTTRRIEFALDAADLADLLKAAERGKRKTIAARGLAKSSGLEIVVAGAWRTNESDS